MHSQIVRVMVTSPFSSRVTCHALPIIFDSKWLQHGKKTEWVCFNWETLQFQVQDQQEIMQSIKTNYIQRGDKIVQNEYYCDLRVKVRQLLRSP